MSHTSVTSPPSPTTVSPRVSRRAAVRASARLLPLAALLPLLWGIVAAAQPAAALTGRWSVNAKLSDDTDDQVEDALRRAGEKITRSWFNRDKEFYRGGPAEQELYDRLSYDTVLAIDPAGDHFRFTYADDFSREVFTDDRSRAVSLTGLDAVEDFSLGHFEDERFVIETHPRDGGVIHETYRLLDQGLRLEVELELQPSSFSESITLRRVYDRSN
jgi:hypothetical protein